VELIPIALWLAVLAVLWLAGLPLAATVFGRFPDRGAAFGLPISVLVASLVAYLIGQFRYGSAVATLAAVAPVLVGLVALRRGASVDWGDVREPAAVFLVAFGFLLVLRGGVPAITPLGGEQFLDFALLNAILRAEALPPEDPWFAGERVRYYYGGYLSTALLTEISGVRPAIAYNLAVATFYAMLVTAAYGLAGAIADAGGRSHRLAGVFGAYLVGFSGNLATPSRLLLGVLPEEFARQRGRFLIEGIRRSPDFDTAFVEATSLSTFDFWRARHVIPETPTVFPFWTFLNGDLRPHMMSAPFLLLAVACCFVAFRSATDRNRRLGTFFGVLPPIVAYLGLANTWDLPTALGVVFLTVVLGSAATPGRFEAALPEWLRDGSVTGRLASELARVLEGGTQAGVVGALSVPFVVPYLLFGTATSDGVGLFPPRSNLGGLILVYGTFLVVFAVFLVPRLFALVRDRPRLGVLGTAVGGPGLVAAGLALEFPALSLFGPLLVAGWVLARTDEGGFETVLLVAGAGLVLVIELAYLRVWPPDPDAVRWNTVYKVSLQVWLLWGVGGAVALADVVPTAVRSCRTRVQSISSSATRGTVPGLGALEGSTSRSSLVGWARATTLLGLVVLLASAGTVGTVTSAGWVDQYRQNPGATNTLDGTAHVATTHAGEAEAIDWLGGREGTPTVVTAPAHDDYEWASAPASLTGIPTVVGWRHVAGYHGRSAYERRVRDVDRIYAGNETIRRQLLAVYEVEYVYVGPTERDRYGDVAVGELPGVRVAHRSGNVTIYEVNLAGQSGDRGTTNDQTGARVRFSLTRS
jgi:YYY domain-containing protein